MSLEFGGIDFFILIFEKVKKCWGIYVFVWVFLGFMVYVVIMVMMVVIMNVISFVEIFVLRFELI